MGAIEMTATQAGTAALSRPIVLQGIRDSFAKLDPRVQVRNPVMFVVFVGSLFTTALGVAAALGMAPNAGRPGFVLMISAWLWLTVLFANFAEAVAEGRGKAQAAALRSTRKEVQAKKLKGRRPEDGHTLVQASSLRCDDIVLVETLDVIPADGEVIDGVASVDESAITGESAPVLRESGGDRRHARPV
jgi:K+-transporting ATPase ATPase B chain